MDTSSIAFCRFSLWMPARELHANASTTLPSDTRSACYRPKHTHIRTYTERHRTRCNLKTKAFITQSGVGKQMTLCFAMLSSSTVIHSYVQYFIIGITWYCGIRARWLVWLLSKVKTSKTPTQFTRNLQKYETIIISRSVHIRKSEHLKKKRGSLK